MGAPLHWRQIRKDLRMASFLERSSCIWFVQNNQIFEDVFKEFVLGQTTRPIRGHSHREARANWIRELRGDNGGRRVRLSSPFLLQNRRKLRGQRHFGFEFSLFLVGLKEEHDGAIRDPEGSYFGSKWDISNSRVLLVTIHLLSW